MAMMGILKEMSTGEDLSVVRMLFFRLYHLVVTSPTTKCAGKTMLLFLRGSSSLCLHAAVILSLCLPLLTPIRIYVKDRNYLELISSY